MTFAVPKVTPTPDNTYEFQGWYLDENFQNLYVETFLTQDTNLYAKIVKKQLFTVTFTNQGDASFVNVEQNVYSGLRVEKFDESKLNAPQGKVFKEWYIKGTTQVFSLETPITANYELEPHFIDITGNEEKNLEKYLFKLENDEYVITGLKSNNETVLYLPGVYMDKKVTKIKENAFLNNKEIEKVILNDNTKEIGNSAFKGTTKLSSIDFKNVEIIGNNAFQDSQFLYQVVIPNTTISIGDYAFKNASNIRFVTIGSKVNSIGVEAFSGTLNYNGFVYIPRNVQIIKENAFNNSIDKSSGNNGDWGGWTSTQWGSFAQKNKVYVEAESKPEGFAENFAKNNDIFYGSKKVIITYNNLDNIVVVAGTQGNKVIKPNEITYQLNKIHRKRIGGWYKDIELATEFTFNDLDKSNEDVLEELTLYAKWVDEE